MARIDPKIYEEGIRFECQCSGKCCRFRDGYNRVYVTPDERRALARARGLSTSAFTREYCIAAEGEYSLKAKDGACVFLDKGLCSVYEARPLQCRTWPFWPENMSPKAWAAVSAFCPGVGKGPLIPAASIGRKLAAQAAADTSTE